MTRIRTGALILIAYLLHQDVWFWRDATPIVFGVLPVGLFYHAVYTLGVSVMMWWLVRSCWPAHLDAAVADAARSVPPESGQRDTR